MVRDARVSRSPVNGSVEFASGDAGTTKDLITIRDEENISINDYVISYDNNATNTALVELYDDDEGTSSGSVSGRVEALYVDPGDEIDLSGISRSDIENDLVVQVTNNDGDISITVGAYKLSG